MSRPGDFNLDGTAGNAADLVYLASNLDTITPKLNIHDLNRDGVVDASDVDYLANYIVGNTGYNLPNSTILGYNITASGDNIVAIGNNSSVTHENSIVIGQGATTSGPNQIIIGNNNQNVFINGTIQFGSFSINGPLDASSLHIDNNVGIGTNTPSCKVDISSNDAIKIPVGTDTERPSNPSLGQIRYNSELSTYEGYGAGNAWGSLGGVKDVDGDTKIIAESSAGADNDQLQFFTRGNERMRIDENGNIGIGGEPSSTKKLLVSGDVRIEGDLSLNGVMHIIDTDNSTTEMLSITNDGTGPALTINQKGSQPVMDIQDDSVSVLYVQDGGNVGINTTTPTCRLDISSNDALKVPIGNSIQRPNPSSLGQIRYNSELSTYEGFGAGNAWGSLGGVKDVDGDTKIIAESSAGADNDQLQFFTGGNERMRIDENGNIGIGAEPSSSSKLIVSGDISGNVGNFTAMNVSGDISGNVGNFTAMNVSGDISGNTGSFTAMNVSGDISGNVGNFTAMNVSGDISGNVGNFTGLNLTNSLKIPVGDTSQRAPDALGQIRYNTDQDEFEGYGVDSSWNPLGSAIFNDNLVKPPKPIVFKTHPNNSDPTRVYLSWEYPEQYQIGFMNLYLPMINSIDFQFEVTLKNGNTRDIDLTSSLNTSSNSVKYSYNNYSLTTTRTPCTGIVFTNSSTELTGFRTVQFPDDPNGQTRYCYFVYDGDFKSNLEGDSAFKVTAYYKNYNPSSNPITLDVNIFAEAGKPSAPQTAPSFSSVDHVSCTITSGTPKFQAENLQVLYVNQNLQYQFTYSSPGDSVWRYGGGNPITDSETTETGSLTSAISGRDKNITNLIPDSIYTVVTRVKNDASTEYSDDSSSNTFATTHMTGFSTDYKDVIFPTSGSYNCRNVSGASVSRVFFDKTSFTSNTMDNAYIHTKNNRGSKDIGIFTIRAYMTEVNTEITNSNVSVNYDGFSSLNGSTKPSDATSSDSYLKINTTTPNDVYTTNYQKGYYLNCANSVTINSEFFTHYGASANYYKVYVGQKRNAGTTRTSEHTTEDLNYWQFYHDNVQSTPGVQSLIITPTTFNSIQISGVHILYNTLIFSTAFQLKNIGRYFVHNGWIVHYVNADSSTYTSSTIPSDRDTEITNNTALPTDTWMNYTNTNIKRTLSTTAIVTSVNVTVQCRNAKGTTSSTITSNTIDILYDYSTYENINNYSASTMPSCGGETSADYTTGLRLISPAPTSGHVYTANPASSIKDASYNHATDISTTYDLQIFRGRYRTKGTNTDGYLNYNSYIYDTSDASNNVDYSSIAASGHRYADFVWKVSNRQNSNYTTLQMRGKHVTTPYGGENAVRTSNPTYKIGNGGPDVKFYYRVEDLSNPVFNDTNKNTGWVDILQVSNGISGQNYYTTDSILGGANSPASNNYWDSEDLVLTGLLPSFTHTSSNEMYIHVRIAAPMDANFEFRNIQLKLS